MGLVKHYLEIDPALKPDISLESPPRGGLSIDRRKGAVISIDADKLYAMQELREDLQVILAKAVCKNISKEEVHQLVDEIYSNYADET